MTTRAKLHIEVPRIISERLESLAGEDLIIDMTSGDKYISNILYASASLSKIQNLFFLFVNKDKLAEDPEILTDKDYSIEVISPLENMESIGRNNFFEVVYYRERVNQLLLFYRNVHFESTFLENMLTSQLNASISNYFLENFTECIVNLGQIIEEIAIELCDRIKQLAKGEIKEKLPRTFDEAIIWLRVYFCEPIRAKKNKDLLKHEEQLKNLQTVDILVDLVRVYRNINTHPYDVLRDRDDARLVLNNTLYVLENINEAGVFLP